MSSTESTSTESTSTESTSAEASSEQDAAEQDTTEQDAPQQESSEQGTGSTAWKDFHHNTRPSHKTTPMTVVGAPTNLVAFAGVISVCVLPVAAALAHPRVRALVRQVLPRF